MAGYPAHEHAEKILANLNAALASASGDAKAKIEGIIAALDPIKDNRTFMRTQKAERLTETILPISANPDAAALDQIESVVGELAERVRTMVIRMT